MEKYEKKFFEEIIKKSKNYVDVCKNLNLGTTYGNRQTIKKYVELYNLDVSHFTGQLWSKGKTYKELGKTTHKTPLSEILVKGKNY